MAKVGRLVKETAVKELSDRLSQRPDFLVASVNRLTAGEADNLRQKLFASQARLVMIKRTLGKRMLDQRNLAAVTELFEGSVGIVLPGEEILPAAKILVDFIKTREEKLAVRGGFIDGMLLDKTRVEQLASLPPKPVLLAQVLATIEAPIADVIFTLERLIGDLIWAADQAAEKKPLPAAVTEGQAGAPAAPPEAKAPETPKPETEQPKTEQPPTTQEGTPA